LRSLEANMAEQKSDLLAEIKSNETRGQQQYDATLGAVHAFADVLQVPNPLRMP